jgi:hypothetical protein
MHNSIHREGFPIASRAARLLVFVIAVSVTGALMSPQQAQGSSSCSRLGFTGYISCDNDRNCDTGSISVTVGSTTKSLRYDGAGFYTGTGYNNGNPGIPQTIAVAVAAVFNSDLSSPYTATVVSDSYLYGGYDVQFANRSGGTFSASTSISVTSDYGSFSYFGSEPIPFEWTWTPLASTGGDDPNYLTEVSPLSCT